MRLLVDCMLLLKLSACIIKKKKKNVKRWIYGNKFIKILTNDAAQKNPTLRNMWWAIHTKENLHEALQTRLSHYRHVYIYTFLLFWLKSFWLKDLVDCLHETLSNPICVYLCQCFQSEWRDMLTLAYVLFAAFYTCQHGFPYFLKCAILLAHSIHHVV